MMNWIFMNSAYAGVTISLLSYFIGTALKKKINSGWVNPLLVSIALTIAFLVVAKIDYNTYSAGAKYLSWLLTPSTVCLAIPLYEKWELLKKNHRAVILGLLAGTITSLVTIFALSKLMGLGHKEYVTLLPKSITTAIGMVVSEEYGGYANITVAVIVVTGVLGNMAGEIICKIFKITDPIAKGLSFGCSSHAIGTAKAMEIGDIEGAMGGLAIALTGMFTVIFMSFFVNLI